MKNKFLLFLITILVLLIGFFFWGSSSTLKVSELNSIEKNINPIQPQPNETLSIITYNLGYLSGMTNNRPVARTKDLFDNNLNKTLEIFQNLTPDFVAFQEIDFNADRSYNINQMNELMEKHPFIYSAKAVNWDKAYVPFPYWPISKQFGKINSGQALLSQHEIIGNDIVSLIKPKDNPFYYNAFYLDRLIQIIKLVVNGREMVIMNLHLEAFHAETRNAQVKTVLKEFHKYSEHFPVIVCGDFNSTPPGVSQPYQDDHVIQTLLNDYQMEMAIGLEENSENEKSYFTFESVNPDRRLDYFFYNPKFIQLVNARVIHEAGDISDHLPVLMQFVFR
ncbi:MAG: endonuclease/exonuclease/phosphatase family protein [Salibacteraceae bacterium]